MFMCPMNDATCRGVRPDWEIQGKKDRYIQILQGINKHKLINCTSQRCQAWWVEIFFFFFFFQSMACGMGQSVSSQPSSLDIVFVHSLLAWTVSVHILLAWIQCLSKSFQPEQCLSTGFQSMCLQPFRIQVFLHVLKSNYPESSLMPPTPLFFIAMMHFSPPPLMVYPNSGDCLYYEMSYQLSWCVNFGHFSW